MLFDALTTSAVAAELRIAVLGGRVQHVLQPDDSTVALEVYAQRRRLYLTASIHPQHSRVYLTAARPRRGVETATALLLLLRKYVQGGRLITVEQPAWERILLLGFEGDEGPVTLVCEIMGRLSNLILLDAGQVVLDSLKRVTPDMTRARLVLPRQPYMPPPPRVNPAPSELTEEALRALLASASPDQPLWRTLLNGQRGLSPLVAREIAYRAAGNPEVLTSAAPVGRLVAVQAELVEPVVSGHWQPSLVRQGERVEAFAPYRLTQHPGFEPVDSISVAIEAYHTALAGRDPYHGARADVQRAIDQARERLRRRHESLSRAAVGAEEVERLRLSGELILAYAPSIMPGQNVLEAEYDSDRPPLRIALDPELGPIDNAQGYFRDYEKAKGAAEGGPARLAETDLALQYVDQLETDLALASNRPEIAAVHGELVEARLIADEPRGATRRRSAAQVAGGPLRLESPDGFVVWVGRNSRQNDAVTFSRGMGHDLWLHARGVPGAHVIVKTEGRPVPNATIEFAARLAAAYSRARGATQVAVDVTEQRQVRRIKGAGPGMVTYRNERTVTVRPEGTDWLELEREDL